MPLKISRLAYIHLIWPHMLFTLPEHSSWRAKERSVQMQNYRRKLITGDLQARGVDWRRGRWDLRGRAGRLKLYMHAVWGGHIPTGWVIVLVRPCAHCRPWPGAHRTSCPCQRCRHRLNPVPRHALVTRSALTAASLNPILVHPWAFFFKPSGLTPPISNIETAQFSTKGKEKRKDTKEEFSSNTSCASYKQNALQACNRELHSRMKFPELNKTKTMSGQSFCSRRPSKVPRKSFRDHHFKHRCRLLESSAVCFCLQRSPRCKMVAEHGNNNWRIIRKLVFKAHIVPSFPQRSDHRCAATKHQPSLRRREGWDPIPHQVISRVWCCGKAKSTHHHCPDKARQGASEEKVINRFSSRAEMTVGIPGPSSFK